MFPLDDSEINESEQVEANLMAADPCQEFVDRVARLRELLKHETDPQLRFILIRAHGKAMGQLQACRAAQPTSNLAIVGIEKTQATQFFLFNGMGSGFAANNTVPLVAHKDLILRVYIDRTNLLQFPRPASVTGQVAFEGHPDLLPLNGPIPGMPASSLDRGNQDHTLNFRVPASYCTGTVKFTVTVFDPANPDNPASRSKPETVFASFDSVPHVRIHGVLIHYTGRGLDIAAPTGLDLINTLAWVGRAYPISGFDFTACEILDFNGDLTISGGGGCGVGWGQLMDRLFDMRNASGTNDVFVGLLPAGVPTSGVIGCGGGGVAVAYVNSGRVLAQEIGHAFGRAHAPCGNPGGPDPNYPTYDSYPSGSIGEFGFDSSNSQVFNPALTFDFMSYCGPVWTSPYTYVNLKNEITAAPAAAHPERAGGHATTRDYLYLNFRLSREGKVELLPSFHLYGLPPTTPVVGQTPIWIDLIDTQGQIIESHHCRLIDPHQDPNGPYIDFHEAIPWSAEVRSIVFRHHGEVLPYLPGFQPTTFLRHEAEILDTIEVEERPPVVTLHAPKRVEQPSREELSMHTAARPTKRPDLMRLEWSVTQPQEAKRRRRRAQGEEVETEVEQPQAATTYLLRYSHDGGQTWRAVAAGLTEPRHVVNLDLLPGGEQSIFQVVASSGIRTSTVETEPFAVPQKPRQAYIVSPEPGATFKQGEPVMLLGGGFSPDFGITEFEDVVWSSDRDGVIGVGYQVIRHTLSAGRHRILLRFPDGLGGEVSGSVFVTIK